MLQINLPKEVYHQETTLVLAMGYGGLRYIATPIVSLKETGTKGKTKAEMLQINLPKEVYHQETTLVLAMGYGGLRYIATPIVSLKETGTKGKTKAVLIGNITYKRRDTRTDIV
ncbi:hypothetical protein QE152_g32261 [Popillia japonica]|uniref:Uncharacterized protein n=1 Tax=Popillia japonica TaxID=7064 RepID=A0AAW1IZI6_POPJA